MKVIYEPKGKAFEYSPLAANLSRGCVHSCVYCYVPPILRMSKADFHKYGNPRKDVLKWLEKDAAKLHGDSRPVFLSFTTDPYQDNDEVVSVTHQALNILGQNNLKVHVLTKNPYLALNDIDIFKKYKFELGSTIHSNKDASSKKYEPKAIPNTKRIKSLKIASDAGVKTFVSMEPVYNAGEAIDLLHCADDFIDTWKIGKLNHSPAVEKTIDWSSFLERVIDFFTETSDSNYLIKDDLWKFKSKAMRQSLKSRGVKLYKPKAT